ncbi:MAG: phytanoyl-CoA dioxygenase family protein [Flavobacteriaceae bacterium]|nr:phytanoyl-CoA dioxygenase family protein [Flavobacteriaceae bacterium]
MQNNQGLNSYYSLSKEQISFFQRNKFIKLKKVFSKEIINHYNEVISKTVDFLSKNETPLNERDAYGKAFLQLMNLWRENDEVKEFVFSKRLARIASNLMGISGVRMYHDQALFKEAGGGITPWHADQYYWPLESDKTITAWIPLQETSLEMGPLEFSSGSHKIKEGRDLDISDASEKIIQERLRVTDFDHIVEKFDLGEVSFHSGWVFHRAGANKTNNTRKAMTVIYMDHQMKLKEPENDGQENDWNTWCPNAVIGEVISTHLNPILYKE